MALSKTAIAALGLGALALLILLASVGPGAMLENARLLHSLGVIYSPDLPARPEVAWDNGWGRLCVDNQEPLLPDARALSARRNTIGAALRLGDFPAAVRTATDSISGSDPDAARIVAMLRADWTAAVRVGEELPPEVPPAFWGTVLYLAGQQVAADGDTSMASRLLTQADPLLVERGPLVSTSLARCLTRWGRAQEAAQEWRRAAAFLPPDPDTIRALTENLAPFESFVEGTEWLSTEQAHPTRAVEGAAIGGWALVGFDIDLQDVRVSPLLHVTTYWATADRPNQVAARHLVVRDLVANGGLEWDFAPSGVLPFGFPASVYYNHVPVTVEPTYSHGNAVCITRPSREEGVGLQGLQFGLSQKSRLLVQGGDILSPNGSGYALGRRWFGTPEVNLYNYLASGQAGPPEWVSFSGAVERPASAGAVSVWLLNASGDAGGKTCYADQFLFEAIPPDIAGEHRLERSLVVPVRMQR